MKPAPIIAHHPAATPAVQRQDQAQSSQTSASSDCDRQSAADSAKSMFCHICCDYETTGTLVTGLGRITFKIDSLKARTESASHITNRLNSGK